MKTKEFKRGHKLQYWFNNHPVWVILGIVSFVLSLSIAAGTVFTFAANYVHTSILWKEVEQRKIDELAPTQTVSFFSSLLGEPNVKTVLDDITRYVYKERGYWVEVFSDRHDIVQMFDITACGDEGFYPRIKNNPVGGELIIGKSKMIDTTGSEPWVWNGANSALKVHYFQRGATAPSYYYDEYYGGNPSNYQTVFTGHNELCGYLVLPSDISAQMNAAPIGKNPLNAEQTHRLRSATVINTFAITAPSFELKVKELENIADGGMGVSYVDEGVLMSARDLVSDRHKDIPPMKDFEVFSPK